MLFLLISCITLWCSILIDAKPQDLFSFDANNELTEPVSKENDLISLQSPNGLSSNDISLSDFVFTLTSPTSKNDIDPYDFEVGDLFPEENHSVDMDPFLQSDSACETNHRLSWVDDSASNLQARDDSSCTPSEPQESIDSITDLFQDPENFLRQRIPPTKTPTGQLNQLDQDEDGSSFDTLLNNRPAPLLFEEDGNKCPMEAFGLSTTPVCLDSLKGSAIGNAGSGFTLYDVEPCKSRSPNTVMTLLHAGKNILMRQQTFLMLRPALRAQNSGVVGKLCLR